jgi:hypothetical protein
MNLVSLKSELFKRLNYDDEQKEAIYQSKINKLSKNINPADVRFKEYYIYEMNILLENKLLEIRKDLNDDDGFKRLVSELDNVKFNKYEKETELKSLVPPNKPNLLQKLYTNVFGKINTADAEINNFNNNTKDIQNEIADFKNIIYDIETLIPIYQKTQGGAKTKTRRNRNSYKSIKNRRKSNCRY